MLRCVCGECVCRRGLMAGCVWKSLCVEGGEGVEACEIVEVCVCALA